MAPEDVFVVRSAPQIDKFEHPRAGTRRIEKGAASLMGYVGVIGQQEGMDLLVRRPSI